MKSLLTGILLLSSFSVFAKGVCPKVKTVFAEKSFQTQITNAILERQEMMLKRNFEAGEILNVKNRIKFKVIKQLGIFNTTYGVYYNTELEMQDGTILNLDGWSSISEYKKMNYEYDKYQNIIDDKTYLECSFRVFMPMTLKNKNNGRKIDYDITIAAYSIIPERTIDLASNTQQQNIDDSLRDSQKDFNNDTLSEVSDLLEVNQE